MTTIQQLEVINYENYSESPDELFTIAKQFLSIKKFEKGIEILENAINLAIKKYGNEVHIECARFYDEYADALIRKLMESDEILAIRNENSNDNPVISNKSNMEAIMEEKLREKEPIIDGDGDEDEDSDDIQVNDVQDQDEENFNEKMEEIIHEKLEEIV